MNVAGVIAEYNPFHKGHQYMLRELRRQLGPDTAVVCAMSGSFVQRGECAAFSKQARAEAAVRCGADLVLELPLPWALSSAESFAQGGVELLAATGVVTHLCFGSECGQLPELERTAEALLSPAMDGAVRRELASGISYAAARQRALEQVTGESAALLSQPNNILAVEYLKALRQSGAAMEPLTLPRRGAGHDEAGGGDILSASEIRRRLREGEDPAPLLPGESAGIFEREREAGRLVSMATLETALLSRLRMLPREAYAALPDCTEGLDRRLYTAVHTAAAWEEVLSAAKSKRYALSRLRRMLLGAALGLRAGDREGGIPYLRVLALSPVGRELLRRMKERSSLPVLLRPAGVKGLEERARRLFQLESDASDLYVLGFGRPEDRRPGSDWRSTPFVL